MNEARTVIVGAGQAGLAVSRYLTEADHNHVLLERARVGERWRSERWDSLTLLSPNWLNMLPGAWPHDDPDAFLSRQGFVDYLDRYARSFAAPVREGAAVRSVERRRGWFRVATDVGDWRARNVVVATGWADVPTTPRLAASAPDGVLQLHSSEYRSPVDLPPGGVLVVGAGPSGAQIALELRRAGRPVVVTVGRHARMPRRYRGRDIWFWLGQIGNLDERIDEVADPGAAPWAPSLVVSGANGGAALDLRVLGDHGVTVAGRLDRFDRGQAVFLDDLDATTGESDRAMRGLLDRIDACIDTSPCADDVPRAEPIPALELPEPPRSLDLAEAGISTIIWATGYGRSYNWLHLPALGADGEFVQRRGVTRVPGLYVVGLRFQYRRKSHFIGGVGEDAQFMAERIVASDPDAASCKLRRLLALARSERARSMTKPCTWCPVPPHDCLAATA
jgi:putative flavoprotein involved in K+ transport